MSIQRLSRRGLFEALLGRERSSSAQRAPSFTLDRFYSKREASGPQAIPAFDLRSDLPDARQHSTVVGVPELCAVAREPSEEAK